MAVAGYKARLLVGDFNLAAYATSMSAPWEQDMLDTTVFTSAPSKSFIPGVDGSTFTVEGLYDTAEHADLAAWKTAATAQALTYAPSGLTAGSELWLVNALQTQLVAPSTTSAVAAFNLSTLTDGATDFGVSLVDLAAVTSDTSGSAINGTASSANGGVAHLHVTAFSGFSSAVVIVEDSATGSSGWATIGTFTTVAGVTGERITIAGTIRQYTRYSVDVTGSGSITLQVGLARR